MAPRTANALNDVFTRRLNRANLLDGSQMAAGPPTPPWGNRPRQPYAAGVHSSDWLHVRQLTSPCQGSVPWQFARGEHQERGWSMTEQVPEDLAEAEVADRLEADRSEDEGDTASEVDRWDDEGGHDRVG
jgi:hypothetical protein